jgi:four helix bundle protein
MSYVPLNQLDVYQISCEYSDEGWKIYESLPQTIQFHIGSQMIDSVDSVGANIAEDYGRFHFLDKIRFYYTARGSLFESKHWLDLLFKRKFIANEKYQELMILYKRIQICLNILINSVYRSKK